MFKKSIVVFGLSCLAASQCSAYIFTDGETKVLNFSTSLSGTPFQVRVFANYTLDGGNKLIAELYDGLDLTGGLIGTYAVNSLDYRTIPGLVDGTFSVRVKATGTPAITSISGGILAYRWINTNFETLGIAEGVQPQTSTNAAATVPEPGSLLLVALAGLALGGTRRRSASA